MSVSLMICTRNRASQLEEALASIEKLEFPTHCQVVIVDNGSSDGTSLVIERFKSRATVEVVIAFEPSKGLGVARNCGCRKAHGEILVFTDDDCYPARDYLLLAKQCFDEDPNLGFIGGRILLHDPTDYPITIQESDSRQEILPGDFLEAGLIQGANMAIRRTALESVGGFDVRLGAGAFFACEDVDVLARISARGWHGAYDPRPLVYHHHRRKYPAEVKPLIKQYARARGAYYAKCLLNPALRKNCLKNVYWGCRKHPLGLTLREFYSMAEFFARLTLSREFRRHTPREMG